MFNPKTMAASSTVRYAHRDRLLGMGIAIWRGMHPQPIMTVNTKAYSVTLKEGGWRRAVNVYVNVGAREYEKEWFDAMAGQMVTISDETGYPDGASISEQLRVEQTAFNPVQTMVIADDGKQTSQLTYEGRLTLLETLPSFLFRQLQLVLENSFLILATALATGVVTILLSILHTRLNLPSAVPGTRKAGGRPGRRK